MFNIMFHGTKGYGSTSLQCNHVFLICLLIFVTGCVTEPPPATPTITFAGSPQCILAPNQSLPLGVNLPDPTPGMEYKWTASAGMFTTPDQTTPGSSASGPIVTYIAPDNPIQVKIRVDVTNDTGAASGELTCSVEATPTPIPTATDTPVPTDTPTPTSIPEPIACNNPAITDDVFAQLVEVDRQFPFYGPLTETRFLCEGVFDLVHSGRLAIRFKYDEFGTNFGFWGIGVPTDSPFDISNYREICFWVYAHQPLQTFRLRMKDVNNREDGPTIVTNAENSWEQICTPLTEFSDLGIQLDQLENINLGFNADTHNAEIWVDDFQLIE